MRAIFFLLLGALLLAGCGGDTPPTPTPLPTATAFDALATARVEVVTTATAQAAQTSTAIAAVPLSSSDQAYEATVISETNRLLTDYLANATIALKAVQPGDSQGQPRVIASVGLASLLASTGLERPAPPAFAAFDVRYKAGLGHIQDAWIRISASTAYWSATTIARAQMAVAAAIADLTAARQLLPGPPP